MVKLKGVQYAPYYEYRLVSHPTPSDSVEAEEDWGLHLPFLKAKQKARKAPRRHISFSTGAFEDLYFALLFPSEAPAGMKTGWEIGVGEVLNYKSMFKNKC